MAEILKRQFNIIVLKTEVLDLPVNGDDVQFTLQFHMHGVLHDEHRWSACTRTMGLTDKICSGDPASAAQPLKLPDQLLEDLKNWFNAETDGDRPLWVHLVKPYGILRFMPWERLLGEALQVPILMLPDFIFPPPHELTSVLDVAVCCSAPLMSEHASVQNALDQAIDGILSVQRQHIRIHVFADQEFAVALRDKWPAAGQNDSKVIIYDNAVAAAYVDDDPAQRVYDKNGALRSPWLLWMRDALKGRSIDIVHFICHGYLVRHRGALLFAQSPLERTSRYLAGPATACELQTFLTQVGAWSTVFTSPPDNYSEAGLRALADDIAQSRPGPMMMHVLREDPASQALAAGYQFLYSPEAQHPPRSTALFIYCQPYLSIDALSGGSPDSALAIAKDMTQENNADYFSFKTSISRNTRQYGAIIHSEKPSPLDQLFDDAYYGVALVNAADRISEQAESSPQEFLDNARRDFSGVGSRRGLPDVLASIDNASSDNVSTDNASTDNATFFNDRNVTRLVASTERFSEQVQLRYQQLARDEVLPPAQFEQQMQVAIDTVNKLRQAVADQKDADPDTAKARI